MKGIDKKYDRASSRMPQLKVENGGGAYPIPGSPSALGLVLRYGARKFVPFSGLNLFCLISISEILIHHITHSALTKDLAPDRPRQAHRSAISIGTSTP